MVESCPCRHAGLRGPSHPQFMQHNEHRAKATGVCHVLGMLHASFAQLNCENLSMQEAQVTPGEVSHYSDEFTAVTTVRALTNCDFFVLDAAEFHAAVAEFTGARAELLKASIRQAWSGVGDWGACSSGGLAHAELLTVPQELLLALLLGSGCEVFKAQ